MARKIKNITALTENYMLSSHSVVKLLCPVFVYYEVNLVKDIACD